MLQLEDVDVDVQDRINILYDAVMTLLKNYQLWWNGMRDIRQNYMLPLVRKLQQSPDMLQEIVEARRLLEAVKASVARPRTPGMEPADSCILQGLSLGGIQTQVAIHPR